MREITVGVAVGVPELVPWRYALDLAAGSGARLRVVMANESFAYGALAFVHGDVLADSLERVRGAWEESADMVERSLREQAHEQHVELTLVRDEGRAVDVILDAGKRSDLIVVGRGMRSEEHPGSLGSRVELLARRCGRALLMAPREHHAPRRVVAAYAGKPLGERVLSLAAELARSLKVDLVVLTVGDDPGEIAAIQDRARERLGARKAEYVAELGKPTAVIPSSTGERDLVVMGPHGRSPMFRLLLGNVTDRVIRAVRGPVALAARDD